MYTVSERRTENSWCHTHLLADSKTSAEASLNPKNILHKFTRKHALFIKPALSPYSVFTQQISGNQ